MKKKIPINCNNFLQLERVGLELQWWAEFPIMLLSFTIRGSEKIGHCHGLRSCLQWRLGVKITPPPHRPPSRLFGVSVGRVRGSWATYLAVPSGLALHNILRPSHVAVFCKQKQQQPLAVKYQGIRRSSTQEQQPFNWRLFLEFVLPDIILLVIAVGVSGSYT